MTKEDGKKTTLVEKTKVQSLSYHDPSVAFCVDTNRVSTYCVFRIWKSIFRIWKSSRMGMMIP